MEPTRAEYRKQYRALILAAQAFPSGKKTYCERHHILPRCMGGSDRPGNLIRLTAAQHIRAHLLLARAYGHRWPGLWQAAAMMFDTRPWSDIEGAAEARERAGRAKSRLRHSPATRARIASRRSSPVRLMFEDKATGERHHLTRLEARQTLGLRRDAISHILAGRRKSTRGFRIIERHGS